MNKKLLNKKLLMDGLCLLEQIGDEEIDCTFFDPEYRQIMDKLKFGNEGKSRQKARAQLDQMPDELIVKFLIEIARVSKPSAYIFTWVDKFIVAEGWHNTWFNRKELECVDLVDMVCWKKGFGMGKRTRRTCEYLLVHQVLPKTISNWVDKGIPDCFEEKIPNPRNQDLHPHRKPIEFTSRLIRSVTQPKDVVGDFCAGSFSTFDACKLSGRNFIGCDISEKYADEIV